VFKVIGRLDGAHYAIKRTERKLQSEREKNEAGAYTRSHFRST
jgi:hypothetical protein